MTYLPSDRAAVPYGDLSHYLKEIRRFPMLTAEDERRLSRRWRESGDLGAAHELVTSHLRLVARIAREYLGYGLPLDDLIAEGNQGLMRSIERFEPERGFRLATYATWWIRAAIQEYVLRSWSLVKLGTTAAQKKLFFNLRRLKAKLDAFESGDLAPETVEKIADQLGVSEKDVVDMNRRLGGPDHSLNVPIGIEGEDEWIDWLADDEEDQESRYGAKEETLLRRRMLARALDTLTDREREIITKRRLRDTPLTLERLSQDFGVSRERIRQIEVKAMEKLRRSMTKAGAERGSD